jgi:hypothetical protein
MLDFDVNWWAVLVSTIGAFAIGSIWYSPIMFSKVWQREAKLSDAEIGASNMVLLFGTTIVLAAIQATLFAAAVAGMLGADPVLGDVIIFSLVIGIGWVATTFATGYLFERRSMTLWLINAGYNVALFLAFGLIIGLWQ